MGIDETEKEPPLQGIRLGNVIKVSAARLRECEEAVLVKRARFNGTGKNNFNLRSVCVCVWKPRERTCYPPCTQAGKREPSIGLSDVQYSTADMSSLKTGNSILQE